MKNIALEVENVSKQYRLGEVGTGTISHDLNRLWAKIRGKDDPFLKIGETNDRTKKGDSDYVWALRDLNFQIEQGDAVGIIGRNGAGKSTLLKLLSKVTAPTTGNIKVKGRIASLLEVGTGFHPEMTGRENIYLNGAILGMTKREIKRKFDEIVDFSGVERYIDTPVKRYSSGMYVRLAFAVAAHLESEILIVDEVLAVGDAEFQKKCLGKMGDVSKGEGRTVLFVSHNMPSINTLCNKGIFMKNGFIEYQGNVEETIFKYLGGSGIKSNYNLIETVKNSFFDLKEIVFNNFGKDHNMLLEDSIDVEMHTIFNLEVTNPESFHITYHLLNDYGEAMFSFTSSSKIKFVNGINHLKIIFPANFFQSGNYFLNFFLVKDKREAVLIEKDVAKFTIIDGDRELGTYMGREPGFIRPQFDWMLVE